MKRLLLHTCCAPCVTVPIEKLQSEYNITSFFYNPNIHPEAEYRQRLLELEKLLNTLKTKSIIHNYDSDRWFEFVKGLENEPEGGKRCAVCFRMRLEQTALFAKQEGFNVFTTVLSISPHKNAPLINQIGNELVKQHQVQFLETNFKKQDGFKRSIELSKKYNLYRQNYCGCVYSRR